VAAGTKRNQVLHHVATELVPCVLCDGPRDICYDDLAANWFASGSLVMPFESAPSQINQIPQWRKKIGRLEQSP
jgi:hypothetical protein